MIGNEITQTHANIAQEAAERLTFSSVFSIKDTKANNFGSLIICSTPEEAQRAVKIRLMYEQGSLMQQFPLDYILYHVAYFNTSTGVVESTGIPVPICAVKDIYDELQAERHAKPVDVPEFMKGQENVNRDEKPSTAECTENSGQSSGFCNCSDGEKDSLDV